MVAGRGETKAFSKSGMMVKKFPSNLPGGKRQGKRNSFTILDCIYSETSGTFYILDMMCWDRFQYYDCDTEFRFSWVRQKVLEDQNLGTKSKLNPYSFQTLPFYQSTRESIHQVLNSPLALSDPLDGLLIYHKEVTARPPLQSAPLPAGPLHAGQDSSCRLAESLHGPRADGYPGGRHTDATDARGLWRNEDLPEEDLRQGLRVSSS